MKQICILFLAGLLGVAASIGGSGNLLAQDCQTMIDEMDARLGTGVNLDGEVATVGGTGDLANGSLLENDAAKRSNPDGGATEGSAPVNWGLAIVILVAVAVALVLAGKGVIALRRGRVRAAEND